MGRSIFLVSIVASGLALSACTTRMEPADGGLGDGAIDLIGLELEPASAMLESVDGSTPSVVFRAYARTLDGARVEVEGATFTVSDERIGVIDGSGTFVATARAGGEVEVVARAIGAIGAPIEARATVRVRVDVTLPLAPGVPSDLPDRFETYPQADEPFEAASIEYPLDGARMPNNVTAPMVQWHPRQSLGDGFRIVVEGEHVIVRGFTWDDGRTFTSSWPFAPELWRVVADSARGRELTMRVDRIRAGTDRVVLGAPVSIWLSEDGIFGTLFYWQVRVDPQASDVLRLDAASGRRESVFASEPGTCVGCHALSHDGRRLAATTDARATTWVTAVVDTASASAPPPDLFAPLSPAYHFFAFSPDGARILASRAEGTESLGSTRLALLDGATGAPIAGATGLPTGEAGYPAWSPDGEWVAWMDGGGDGTRGTDAATRIAIAPVEGASALGATRVLHEGAALEAGSLEGGRTDSRPTWSPGSDWIAFAHGTRSVSAVSIDGEPPRASLYLVSREGGEAIRLARGMGREGPVDAFWPMFSPFVTEEADGTRHVWLAFYSRQDYGNDRAGTADTGRRQLWVMAIDPARAAAGEDPSYPPYWLGGQETRADNIAAIWAPTACRGLDESCSASSECCSGECAAADPAMPDVLTCRPPIACRRHGESCEVASDCCQGVCNLGVCGYEPPI
jgi:hypothetical protein